MNSMQDRIVIITGGASGLGAAAARRFAAEGAIVECWDRYERAGTALAGELDRVTFRAVDVADSAAVDDAVAAVVAAHGRVDELINNAGITRNATLLKMEGAQFDQVIGMTRVSARELGRKGVRVNAVTPGFIGIEMVEAMPEKVRTMMAEKAPMQRLGKPEEIADAYVFLASDRASFDNGAVLSVDRGLTL